MTKRGKSKAGPSSRNKAGPRGPIRRPPNHLESHLLGQAPPANEALTSGGKVQTSVSPGLTEVEREHLASCEEKIRKGWGTFMSVGEALLKIRNERLYRSEYTSFEEYYRSRWQYEKSQVYRLIDAAKVLQALSPIGEVSADRTCHNANETSSPRRSTP